MASSTCCLALFSSSMVTKGCCLVLAGDAKEKPGYAAGPMSPALCRGGQQGKGERHPPLCFCLPEPGVPSTACTGSQSFVRESRLLYIPSGVTHRA